MKQVTRYESDDGQVFDTEGACERHEQRQQVIKKIDAGLYLRDCSAEDVFYFVVNNIELFCVPAGVVSSIHKGVIASTYSVWSHGSNVAVVEGTKLLVNVFEKSAPIAVPVIQPPAVPGVHPTIAPYKDFKGNTVYEGDTIVHPSGESGVVVYYPDRPGQLDRWYVRYDNGNEHRLAASVW